MPLLKGASVGPLLTRERKSENCAKREGEDSLPRGIGCDLYNRRNFQESARFRPQEVHRRNGGRGRGPARFKQDVVNTVLKSYH